MLTSSGVTATHHHLVGLARMSIDNQDLQLQRDALTETGCGRIFEEKVSTRSTERPGLAAAWDYLRPGDTLCVWKLDRLGRSVKDVLTIAEDLHEHVSAYASSPAPWPSATTPPAKANSSSP
jgi:DNA invertase Pin-like site-specific DNA recombinase